MASPLRRIVPVILAGGTGSRLWPMSREARPKQLLVLEGERSLLQETALRTAVPHLFAPMIVVTSAAHLALVEEQLLRLGLPTPILVVEPFGRDTAPPVAAAAIVAKEAEPDPLLLVMPADHRIADVEAFIAAIRQGIPAAESGKLVLFGIRADRPATGYGYVSVGEPLPYPGVFTARRFIEKPDRETAERLLADGGYVWNSGVFLMTAEAVLGELARQAPAILEQARRAVQAAMREVGRVVLDEKSFALCPPLSIDRAVMERTEQAAVVPADFGWTEVGSWSALWESGARDEAGNVSVGDVLTEATTASYIRSDGPLVATVGVSNLIVIATPDAVLIADRGHDQEIKAIVERLRAKGSGAV